MGDEKIETSPFFPRKLVHRLFAPVDVAPLVYFRIVFGAIMLWEVWRYFALGRISRHWIDPTFHFTYWGFEWVTPWPGIGMYVHWAVLGLLALCIIVGVAFRVSAVLFFFGFTYIFLLEQANYLNHFYFVVLLSLLLPCIPAHRALSVDAWRRPSLRADTAPAWTLWLLRAQIGMVYFYGGVAKINGDWLHGLPVRMWIVERMQLPLFGTLLTDDVWVSFFSYGGLLLDLLMAPLLLWRRTRVAALMGAVSFHLMNSQIFSIGIFPWLMIAITPLFLPPEWFRMAFQTKTIQHDAGRLGVVEPTAGSRLRPEQRLAVGLLGLYLAVQILVPLRHFLYSGNVSWTEEGHRFSWQMKLRDKEALATFFVIDPARQTRWLVDLTTHLTLRQIQKMSSRPYLLLQFSHYLAERLRTRGLEGVEIHAVVMASLNGRKPQLLIDPSVDLGVQPRTLGPAPWIVPLTEPRRDRPPPATQQIQELKDAVTAFLEATRGTYLPAR